MTQFQLIAHQLNLMQKAALLLSALNHYHLQTDQLLELHHLMQVLVRQLPQQPLLELILDPLHLNSL